MGRNETSDKKVIAIVFGTRPEAIKLLPVYSALLNSEDHHPVLINTGQHKHLIAPILDLWNVKVDHDLDLMKENQSLEGFVATSLVTLTGIIKEVSPDCTLVQGDTNTAYTGAMASFYNKIPCGHVEAGLRTDDLYSPFPEELNRRLISELASLHFCPTQLNQENLKREGITNNVFITGNTVVDSLNFTLAKVDRSDAPKADVLITFHRRENFGKPLEEFAETIGQLANEYPNLKFVFPVHPNPNVKGPIHNKLGNYNNIQLLEPINYFELVGFLGNAKVVITDSGGIQEEAASLGKNLIITRESTERVEIVNENAGVLVGTNKSKILHHFKEMIDSTSEKKQNNLYGSGDASLKIIEALNVFFNG